MQLNEAIEMLKHPDVNLSGKKIWADLGCGSGTFTLALASLLMPGSIIHAIDKNRKELDKIPGLFGQVVIEKWEADFIQNNWPFQHLDGLLMANSLHYVKDKTGFIQKAADHLDHDGCILVVEYDTDRPNPWVPYPLSFSSLKALFLQTGFSSVRKLKERQSVFNNRVMYAVVIEKYTGIHLL